MDDINLILKQQEEADKKNKMMAGLGALGDTASSSQSFGNFFLGRMNPQATGGRELAKSQASDPMERQRKAMEYMKAKREMAQMGAADDPNHADAATYRQQLEVLAPSLKGKLEGMTLAQMERTSPILMAKIRGDQERENARISAGARVQEKRDAQAAKDTEKEEKKRTAMTEVGQRRQDIIDNIDGLQKMIDEDGTWEAVGSHNQDLDRKIEQIATDMAKLMDPNSVARPGEVDSVRRTLIQSGFKNSNDTAKAILENFRSEVEKRAQNAYKIRGMEAPALNAPPPPPPPAGGGDPGAIAELARRKAAKQTAKAGE